MTALDPSIQLAIVREVAASSQRLDTKVDKHTEQLEGALARLDVIAGDGQGIKGQIPELCEMLAEHIKTTKASTEATVAKLNSMETQLTQLQRGQHKIRRGVIWVGGLIKSWKSYWGILGVLGAFLAASAHTFSKVAQFIKGLFHHSGGH